VSLPVLKEEENIFFYVWKRKAFCYVEDGKNSLSIQERGREEEKLNFF